MMKDRVHKMLEALNACSGRSCGLCPYTSPRTTACERMLKDDAADLISDLWGIISQPVQNAPQASQLETRASTSWKVPASASAASERGSTGPQRTAFLPLLGSGRPTARTGIFPVTT